MVTFHVTPCGTSPLGLKSAQTFSLRIMGEESRYLHMFTEGYREFPATSPDLQPQSTAPNGSLGRPKFGMPPNVWIKFHHVFSPDLGLDLRLHPSDKKKKRRTSDAESAALPGSFRQVVSAEIEQLIAAHRRGGGVEVEHQPRVLKERGSNPDARQFLPDFKNTACWNCRGATTAAPERLGVRPDPGDHCR